jgi:hypothetical protein
MHMTTIAMPVQIDATAGTVGVERVSGMDYGTFVQKHLVPRRPVIFTDATREWKALKRWTPQFFKEQYGSKEVSIEMTGKRYIVGDVIDQIEKGDPANPAPYLHNLTIREFFPELLSDIQPSLIYTKNSWLEGWYPTEKIRARMRRLTPVEVYIGGVGGQFPILHYDVHFTHAFLSQIYGEKEYIFYAPDQTPYLYANGGMKSAVNDILNPDMKRFPLFAKATPIKLNLHPGETLFIPGGWWHTARMTTASITVSYNIANGSNWKEFVEDITRGHNQFVRAGLKGAFKAYGFCRSLSGS